MRCVPPFCVKLAVALVLSAAACGDPTEPSGGPDALTVDGYSNYKQPPQAVVGGSFDHGAGFVDWTEQGADLPTPATIISGPQGGQHIWVSVRTKGLWPTKARMGVQFVDPQTGAIAKPGVVEVIATLKTDPTAPDWLLYEALPAFIKEPCGVRDKPMRAELKVVDLYGRTVQDTAVIVPTWTGWCPGP